VDQAPSRALQLIKDGQGTHVVSYHTSTSACSDWLLRAFSQSPEPGGRL